MKYNLFVEVAARALVEYPPLGFAEAERAARKLYSRYGRKRGFPAMLEDVRLNKVRRVWLSTHDTRGNPNGWGRLFYDVAWTILHRRHRTRPIDAQREALEREFKCYALSKGWIAGSLKRAPFKKPTRSESRAKALVHKRALLARWKTKRKRSETAIKKLSAQIRRLEALVDSQGAVLADVIADIGGVS